MKSTCFFRDKIVLLSGVFILLLTAATNDSRAQTTNSEVTDAAPVAPPAVPVLQIKADQVVAKVSPTFYGLMTEDINFALEGGLYAELIRNRTFKANPTNAVYWSAINGSISLDTNQPLNSALNVSLKLDATQATKNSPAGIANGGYWGIPVRRNGGTISLDANRQPASAPDIYHASFYAKAASRFNGALTVAIQSNDGKTIFASAEVSEITSDWKKYEVALTPKPYSSSKDNQLVISTTSPGTIWFQQVSLFPPTYKNRPNGARPDLMELMAGMKPSFLRFPGGDFLEGHQLDHHFDWKKTIGGISERPGHMNDAWGYWTTDGFGLLEFLEWCEDLNMQPVLALYAGYSKNPNVIQGADLQPYVQDALDEIEYVTGDASTKWGAQRVKDGHPAPFPLNYVEIGNEDFFDKSGSYDARFSQFYDAIKAKYPQLQIISTVGNDHPEAMRVHSRTPDLVDEHFYKTEEAMEAQSHMYDDRSRTGPKVFVGEWATRVGRPTPNMAGALGDAAWMCCMERNADLVQLESYAPLFVNVSDLARGGSMQWPSDLIGYDALTSYGSPSYYAQVIFSNNHGDEVLATDSQDVPTYPWRAPGRGQSASPRQVPSVFFDATRDSASGIIFLKIVNRNSTAQPVHVKISGVNNVDSSAEAVVLSADSPDATNSIQEPKKIVPVTLTVDGLGADFTRDFPPYSITILKLKGH